ncbi:MAG: PAS domain-containing protein [Desulfobacteraceae bacterium]|nr:MAG: PAS domain-containing protein [Desulfobacteraceae bacterium]
MKDKNKTKNQLIHELMELRRRLAELKPLEIEHKRTEESLLESERKLSTLIGNLPGVVYRCLNDQNWTMEYISDGFFDLSGFKPSDLIGNQKLTFNELIYSDDQPRVWDQIQEALVAKQPYRVVYRIQNATGEEKWIWDQGVGIPTTEGEIKVLEGFLTDITDKKRLEAELEKAKSLALLGEFSSAVAHQIRNPLGDILLVTKLLQKVLMLDAKTYQSRKRSNSEFTLLEVDRDALERNFWDLSEGINDLNQVVTELLDYTKTLTPSFSTQKLDVILRETLIAFHEIILQNGIQVEEHFANDLPPISVDAVLIGQVFRNIIHNGIQAMPAGGCLFLISGFSNRKRGYISILISDTGIGIPPSEIDKIFHPFYTTKDSGAGLGLSLAHRIIEAHRGKISVYRNPPPDLIHHTHDKFIWPLATLSKGTTIHILLPEDGTHKKQKNI